MKVCSMMENLIINYHHHYYSLLATVLDVGGDNLIARIWRKRKRRCYSLLVVHSIHSFPSILKYLMPNGERRRYLYTMVLEFLRKQSHAQTL